MVKQTRVYVVSRWLEQLREVKQPGVKTVGTHNTTQRSKSMSAPPEGAAEKSGRHIASQEELGELVHMAQPNVARLLSGRSGRVPETWQRVLDALGLELVAVPKGTD